MTVSPSIPADVLVALDRLNMHARARTGWGTERIAIYAYKLLVAMLMVNQGAASVGFVRWAGKCLHCTDGWYRDYFSDRKSLCRYCSGGQITLRFTETRGPDWLIWHHPWEGRTWPGRDLALHLGLRLDDEGEYRDAQGRPLQWQDSRDWHPRGPANRLAIDELVPLLNLVEDCVEALPDIGDYQLHWARRRAFDCLHQHKHRGIIGAPSHYYRLDLGCAPGGCFVCGATEDLNRCPLLGRLTPLFHWSLRRCAKHRQVESLTDLPPAALLSPELKRWLARHERVIEVMS